MKYRPFTLRPVFIDLLLFTLTMAAIGTICWVLVTNTADINDDGTGEQAQGQSMFFSIPLVPIFFYLIRRQFNPLLTVIHILLTSSIVFYLLFCTSKLLELVLDEIEPELNWVMWLSLAIHFVLTKHALDALTNKLMDNKT